MSYSILYDRVFIRSNRGISPCILSGDNNVWEGYIFRMKHVLEWLEAHPDKWDSRRIPLYGLGVEYPWLTEKRKQDAALPPIKRPWTDYELSYLKMQVERGVPYSAIAKELGRSKRSAKCQGHQLGLVSGSRA